MKVYDIKSKVVETKEQSHEQALKDLKELIAELQKGPRSPFRLYSRLLYLKRWIDAPPN